MPNFGSRPSASNAVQTWAKISFAFVGVLLPAAFTSISIAYLFLSYKPLPTTIALRWGPLNQDPIWLETSTVVVLTILFGVVLPLLVTVPLLVRFSSGCSNSNSSFLGAFMVGASFLVNSTLLVTVYLTRSESAAVPMLVALLVVILAVIVACLAWLVQPMVRGDYAFLPVPVAEVSERQAFEGIVWEKQFSAYWGVPVSFALAGIFMLILGLSVLFGGGENWMAVVFFAVCLLNVILFLALSRYTIRVSDFGVAVFSMFGWPKFNFAFSEITSCSSRHIFAGDYAERWASSIATRDGMVTGPGEALRLELGEDDVFEVSVPDAAAGAALVNAYRKLLQS